MYNFIIIYNFIPLSSGLRRAYPCQSAFTSLSLELGLSIFKITYFCDITAQQDPHHHHNMPKNKIFCLFLQRALQYELGTKKYTKERSRERHAETKRERGTVFHSHSWTPGLLLKD